MPTVAQFCFSRERLRRVLRKKHLQNYVSSTSSHLHLCTSTFSPIYLCSSSHLHSQLRIYISAHLHLHTSTSLLMFTSAHLHLCSSSHPHIYMSAHLHIRTSTSHIFTSHLHLTASPLALLNFLSQGRGQCRRTATKRNPLRRSCVSDARNAGESAIWFWRGQPSAEIVPLRGSCRVREMQARVRFVPVRENPLRGSCVSSARNAGESAICPGPGQPSAEIVRVTGELEDENWRLCSTTLVRGAICGAGS